MLLELTPWCETCVCLCVCVPVCVCVCAPVCVWGYLLVGVRAVVAQH